MRPILKVFARGDEQAELPGYGSVIATYDAFGVVEVEPGKVARLRRKFPCQDISAQYELPRARSTGLGKRRGASKSGRRAFQAPSRGQHHYLVQFVGPIKSQWLSRVTTLGGVVRELFRDFIYVVRADAEEIQAIGALPFVRWSGHLPYAERVSPGLRQRGAGARKPSLPPRTRLRTGTYTVESFDAKLIEPISAAARRLGFRVLSERPRARTLVVQATAKAGLAKRSQLVATLATVHGVKFIRARPIRRTSNDVAVRFMGAAKITAAASPGLAGQGEVVGICDTGLDTGDPATLHPDFRGRLLAIRSYPITEDFGSDVLNAGADDGPADLDSGHGTHVAGSALGNGSESAGVTERPIRGLAHKARLVFQAVEQEMRWRPHVPFEERERYALAGIPTDLTELFAFAYRKGARIHSNSWGGGDAGDYDEQCDQLDRFVWTHKDFCVLFAAGNDGTDADGNGRINLGSITPPGTAKNCLTIGACESLRPELDAETYGRWWPQDYPRAPIEADPMANDPDQVVAFSSRGPTRDRRIKPDVLAPGTFILSTRSTQIAENNVGWRAFPESGMYFYMGGTSMATPLAAGAAALVREYLRKKRKLKQPSAALIKAALIAGAKRLPARGGPAVLADNDQGYGRIDLDAVLNPKTLFEQVAPGLRTGEAFATALKVKAKTPRLRVVLVYTDFPGPALVNDLNLILTSPSGEKLTSAGARAGGLIALDSKNNVEVIELPAPERGVWRLDVVASNAPQGPQDFALVVLGASAAE